MKDMEEKQLPLPLDYNTPAQFQLSNFPDPDTCPICQGKLMRIKACYICPQCGFKACSGVEF